MWLPLLLVYLQTYTLLPNDRWPDTKNIILADQALELSGLPAEAIPLNPSIARIGNEVFLVFRCDRFDLGYGPHMQLGVVRLDDQLKPIGTPQLLDLNQEKSSFSTSEDPRLIVWRDELYVTFNAMVDHPFFGRRGLNIARIDRQYHASPNDLSVTFSAGPVSRLNFRVDGTLRAVEKNWVPFVFEDAIHLVYRTNPPQILRIDPKLLDESPKEMVLPEISRLEDPVQYDFGEMRGGSQAELSEFFGGDFIGFFHGRDHTDRGGGRLMHLTVGFYTFEPYPPFAISSILPFPLSIDGICDTTGWGIEVAYPGGFVWHNGHLVVAYGYMDKSVRLLHADPNALRSHLETPKYLYQVNNAEGL